MPLAFSNSSNNINENGLFLTASVSCPPLSYPIYPGAAPINLDTECDSLNSEQSILIIFSLEPYLNSANALHSSVFPTPVGPANKKLATGLSGFDNPEQLLRIALDISSIAKSCPITFSCKSSSSCSNLVFSDVINLEVGIPVLTSISAAMWSSVRGTLSAETLGSSSLLRRVFIVSIC